LSLTPKIQNTTTVRTFPAPVTLGLEFRGVSFTYPGASQPTLRNISFQVQPGESIALVGANGAGKTTLLKLLTRLYDPDEGSIAVDRIPLQAFDLAELRRNIGVLFQDFSRYNLSVRDNIGFGNLPELDNQPLLETATANAGATDIVTRLDRGYQTILGKMFAGGADLSGGQWQKIALARAFMSPAPILILDEPSAALDAIAEAELFQRFHHLAKGKMTFFVSHRFSTVRVADRIVVLDKSQVAEIGTHAELMAREGLYARMFHLQARSYQDNDTNGDRKNIET
ncbi:MAG: ATP-binding cassette domain-containing protein, partial [Coleofasciculaceae cyanobacterium SM2_3_26]|nr:ATP-binding cassette domain-containing protein [Coleofasciculaceae cyanobacterium SM2_3_26]